MVDIANDGSGRSWNLSRRAGLDQNGDPIDVMLIQYLMFMHCEQLTLAHNPYASAYTLGNVTGLWGDDDETLWKEMASGKYEKTFTTHDKYFDRFPPGTYRTKSGKIYKISLLQVYYWNWIDPDSDSTFEEIVLDMPDDGVCPAKLGDVLRTIRDAANATASS